MRFKDRGFTLIELIVVTALISLLAAIVIGAISNTRSKARDTKRIRDAKTLLTAIELYRSSEEELPLNTEDDTGGWDLGNIGLGAGNSFIKPLLEKNILSQPIIENDPGLSSDSYRYRRYDSGTSCNFVFSILAIKLEKPHLVNYNIDDQYDSCFMPETGTPPVPLLSNDDWLVFMIKE